MSHNDAVKSGLIPKVLSIPDYTAGKLANRVGLFIISKYGFEFSIKFYQILFYCLLQKEVSRKSST